MKERTNFSRNTLRAAARNAAVPVMKVARRSLGNDQLLDELGQLRTDIGVRVGYLTSMVESPRASEPTGDPYYEQLLGMLADELDQTKSELNAAIARIERLESLSKRPAQQNGRKA
jgi:hypothetical protein